LGFLHSSYFFHQLHLSHPTKKIAKNCKFSLILSYHTLCLTFPLHRAARIGYFPKSPPYMTVGIGYFQKLPLFEEPLEAAKIGYFPKSPPFMAT